MCAPVGLDKKKTTFSRRSEQAKDVEILSPEGKVKYLGQVISFMLQEKLEIKHRIGCACVAFARHRQELTSKSYLLRHRLRLFNSITGDHVRSGNVDYCPRTRKDDKNDATQGALAHHSNKEETTRPKAKEATKMTK